MLTSWLYPYLRIVEAVSAANPQQQEPADISWLELEINLPYPGQSFPIYRFFGGNAPCRPTPI